MWMTANFLSPVNHPDHPARSSGRLRSSDRIECRQDNGRFRRRPRRRIMESLRAGDDINCLSTVSFQPAKNVTGLLDQRAVRYSPANKSRFTKRRCPISASRRMKLGGWTKLQIEDYLMCFVAVRENYVQYIGHPPNITIPFSVPSQPTSGL